MDNEPAKVVKLSAVMQRALDKLDANKWKTSYDVKERVSTLSALVDKGVAKSYHKSGSGYSPRTCIRFKRK